MPFSFSTKAGTLELLRDHLRSAQIAPLECFTVAEWNEVPKSCIERVSRSIGDVPMIVRSSCQNEDGENASKAGVYDSILNVSLDGLENAIAKVIDRYEQNCDLDEFFVQPMLQDVVRAGVAFSHDPNTCAPYRIINWSAGEDTTVVTGGRGGRIWQKAAGSPTKTPDNLIGVEILLVELIELFGDVPLDFEFAVTLGPDKKEIVWLLQVRRLNLTNQPESISSQSDRLAKVHDKISQGLGVHPFLLGKRTAYGVMPDWNPAEIIGTRPRPLALSLYRELITDSIWAYQRHNYGYRNLRSFPLMQHFFGLPYIDVRLSFNSFIPADLGESLASRLVDYYIERLLDEPNLHDKVEFEIVFSCYTLDLPERLESLTDAGFSKYEQKEIASSLRSLTNRIVSPNDGLWRKDAAKLTTLQDRREQLSMSEAGLLERIYWLLEDAKRYGTLPFAGLARAGFVAVQLLQSLISTGILSRADYDAFLSSISTVGSRLAHDRAIMNKTAFLSQYGHLRPGTYDILSPRYDEAPELYFDWDSKQEPATKTEPFSITLPQMRELGKALDSHGLDIAPVELFDFLQAGIEQRELAKFHFTRNLSDALVLVGDYGANYGFSRDDLSFCDISAVRELHISALDPYEALAQSIEKGKKGYTDTLHMSLPPVITKPDDVWSFEWPAATPNFITQEQVTAPVVSHEDPKLVSGALVCIPNADPGFDWLFSYPIAGLITAWGGANSHMAIRAGENGIPAIVGAGEQLYDLWSRAKKLHIDCAVQRVEILA